MTIEAPVARGYPAVVGTPWVLDGHYGLHAGATIAIASTAVVAKQGHRYRATVTASGMARCEGGRQRVFKVHVSGTPIAKQYVGMERGGFAGLMTVPITLCGIWTAPSDGSVTFTFIMDRVDATNDQDWELANAKHQFFVEDLGP